MTYYHVDVFSNRPFSGNGLTVFPGGESLSKSLMQTITQEMRQFESIFLQHRTGQVFDARVFTMEEELDFAGHPALGAAAVLHSLHRPMETEAEWELVFPSKRVPVRTQKRDHGYFSSMDQGQAVFGKVLSDAENREFQSALGITSGDCDPRLYPLQVVSTGLPYLIVPVKRNIEHAKIRVENLEEKLLAIGAKFIGVLDVSTRTIRTWDNSGQVEDIATGSLAGPAGAYMVRYDLCKIDELILIHQGKNLERESELFVQVSSLQNHVYVSADVVSIASGCIRV